eukprot:jgi/Mesen1/8449/ME000475S07702
MTAGDRELELLPSSTVESSSLGFSIEHINSSISGSSPGSKTTSSGIDLDNDEDEHFVTELTEEDTPLLIRTTSGFLSEAGSHQVGRIGPLKEEEKEEKLEKLGLEEKDGKDMQQAEDENDLERDASSEAFCRICLESEEGEQPGDTLISPCMCKGTQQYVHRSCLDHWRAVKEGFAFAHCTTCKAQFHLRPDVPEDMSWRQRKFQLFVTRDLCFVFVGIQLLIAALAGLLRLVDWNRDLMTYFSTSKEPLLFYYSLGVFLFLVLFGIGGMVVHCAYGSQLGHPGPCVNCGGACIGNCGTELLLGAGCGELLVVAVVILAFLGVLYGVLAAMMAWQRIWQRHYHILAKRVLAEEYIVEDLHGQYKPAVLAPEDEARLKSLGFL